MNFYKSTIYQISFIISHCIIKTMYKIIGPEWAQLCIKTCGNKIGRLYDKRLTVVVSEW